MAEHSIGLGPWLEIAAEALRAFAPVVAWPLVTEVIRAELHAPLAGVFSWSTGGEAEVEGYPSPQTFDLAELAGRAPGRHPLARHYATTHDRRPHASQEFILDDVEREYAEELAFHGIEQHVWIPLPPVRGRHVVVGACRPADPYHRAELELSTAVQPLLVALTQHAETVRLCPTTASAASADYRLTAREAAVLELCAWGLTTASAARRLGIAPRTAHKHLENAYRKLHVRDRVSAVLRARSAGIIALPDEGPSSA